MDCEPCIPDVPIRFRKQLLSAGISERLIRARRDSATWRTLRRGAYAAEVDLAPLNGRARYVMTVAAYARGRPVNGIVSHVAAAAMRDWPLWRVRLDRVHVTREGDGGVNRTAGLHVHARTLVEDQCSSIGEIPVASPAMTVVDCARMMRWDSGVILADAALHRGDVSREQLELELHRARGLKGVARARAVVAFADPLSESPGESRSRVLFAASSLPPMELQHAIRDASGSVIGRTDFAIPELRIAGEFDGKIKYGRLLRPGQSAGDATFEEKKREDAIRDAGWEVVRWIWDELETPRVIIDRWLRAIERARRRVLPEE